MYHVVWEYEVRSDGVETFQSLYGPEGAWARLFRAAEAYRGTELYRDTTRPTAKGRRSRRASVGWAPSRPAGREVSRGSA